jgi:error-prone DNA polymerase
MSRPTHAEDGNHSEPGAAPQPNGNGAPPAYAELHCLTNFSFLRGASHPEELVQCATALGYRALAITDRNSLAGVVRAHLEAKNARAPFHLIIGAEITPVDAPVIVLLATDRAAYGRLCRLITRGRLRSKKGACELRLADVVEFSAGLIGIMDPDETHRPHDTEGARKEGQPGGDRPLEVAERPVPGVRVSVPACLRAAFQDRLYLAAALDHTEPDEERLERLAALSRETGLPLIATNHVHYHVPERRYVQDVLTCIREKCTLAEAGARLLPNAERHLRPLDEIERRYACPRDPQVRREALRALKRTVEVARRCTFSLDELRYQYPHELVPPGRSAMEYLEKLVWAGARRIHGAPCIEASCVAGEPPAGVRALLEAELALIRELRYEHYFLTVWDLCRFARGRGILCQGRGSAANSAVCHCLGVTAVDPTRHDLLFERFISRERNEPPDIDVDFEHERREEVFQYIYEKYGRERAGITAEVITYRPRSAIRDVGKALGLSLDLVDALAKSVDWFDEPGWGDETPEPESLGPRPRAPRSTHPMARSLLHAGVDASDRTIRMLLWLVQQFLGFPRHLSQHVGGFVITDGPLCELVPIENGAMPGRTFIEWDKDDIDALGILKVDCLALGMLTAISKCFAFLRGAPAAASGVPRPASLCDIPREDPAVYDMICAADTIGVFQIESRAQMSMLPRLRPRTFYDLVIEVAIVRPGPIQGGMVHPYLRRRHGLEPVVYPSEAVRRVLEKTLGVPIFQEQVMRLAVVAAGFTPGEADQLRRAMAAWHRSGRIEAFRLKLIQGMQARGYSPEFAERLYRQIEGFGEYGFPESHAASFALLVYASAWLKHYYPAEFCAAMLNSQPLGFYTPGQLIRDAVAHGVEVRPVDALQSEWDCTLEEIAGASAPALRLGLRLVRGLPEARARELIAAREREHPPGCQPATGRLEAWLRAGVSSATLLRLAAADAFRSLGLTRRQAIWDILSFRDEKHAAARPAARSSRISGTGDALPPARDDFSDRDAGEIGTFAYHAAEPHVELPEPALSETVVRDYDAVGFSLQAHPMSLVRDELDAWGETATQPAAVSRRRGAAMILRAVQLKSARPGQHVAVAGLVTCRQRPGTAKGVIFVTLEDETGMANLIVRPRVWERDWRAARNRIALIAVGPVERQNEVVHVMAQRLFDLTDELRVLRDRGQPAQQDGWLPFTEDLRHASRDFH